MLLTMINNYLFWKLGPEGHDGQPDFFLTLIPKMSSKCFPLYHSCRASVDVSGPRAEDGLRLSSNHWHHFSVELWTQQASSHIKADDDVFSFIPIIPRGLDGWKLALASEHNIPLPGVQSDGPGVFHPSSDQCGAHVSVQLGHLDLVQVTVDPVQFPCDPVHGQALGGGQPMLDHHLDTCHSWNSGTWQDGRWEYLVSDTAVLHSSTQLYHSFHLNAICNLAVDNHLNIWDLEERCSRERRRRRCTAGKLRPENWVECFSDHKFTEWMRPTDSLVQKKSILKRKQWKLQHLEILVFLSFFFFLL